VDYTCGWDKRKRKGNETLVRKPPGNYQEEDRGGYEKTVLGYLESDSGWRPKVNFCVCYYIVRFQQDRIGIIHIYRIVQCRR
jgi:hypothetical protein